MINGQILPVRKRGRSKADNAMDFVKETLRNVGETLLHWLTESGGTIVRVNIEAQSIQLRKTEHFLQDELIQTRNGNNNSRITLINELISSTRFLTSITQKFLEDSCGNQSDNVQEPRENERSFADMFLDENVNHPADALSSTEAKSILKSSSAQNKKIRFADAAIDTQKNVDVPETVATGSSAAALRSPEDSLQLENSESIIDSSFQIDFTTIKRKKIMKNVKRYKSKLLPTHMPTKKSESTVDNVSKNFSIVDENRSGSFFGMATTSSSHSFFDSVRPAPIGGWDATEQDPKSDTASLPTPKAANDNLPERTTLNTSLAYHSFALKLPNSSSSSEDEKNDEKDEKDLRSVGNNSTTVVPSSQPYNDISSQNEDQRLINSFTLDHPTADLSILFDEKGEVSWDLDTFKAPKKATTNAETRNAGENTYERKIDSENHLSHPLNQPLELTESEKNFYGVHFADYGLDNVPSATKVTDCSFNVEHEEVSVYTCLETATQQVLGSISSEGPQLLEVDTNIPMAEGDSFWTKEIAGSKVEDVTSSIKSAPVRSSREDLLAKFVEHSSGRSTSIRKEDKIQTVVQHDANRRSSSSKEHPGASGEEIAVHRLGDVTISYARKNVSKSIDNSEAFQANAPAACDQVRPNQAPIVRPSRGNLTQFNYPPLTNPAEAATVPVQVNNTVPNTHAPPSSYFVANNEIQEYQMRNGWWAGAEAPTQTGYAPTHQQQPNVQLAHSGYAYPHLGYNNQFGNQAAGSFQQYGPPPSPSVFSTRGPFDFYPCPQPSNVSNRGQESYSAQGGIAQPPTSHSLIQPTEPRHQYQSSQFPAGNNESVWPSPASWMPYNQMQSPLVQGPTALSHTSTPRDMGQHSLQPAPSARLSEPDKCVVASMVSQQVTTIRSETTRNPVGPEKILTVNSPRKTSGSAVKQKADQGGDHLFLRPLLPVKTAKTARERKPPKKTNRTSSENAVRKSTLAVSCTSSGTKQTYTTDPTPDITPEHTQQVQLVDLTSSPELSQSANSTLSNSTNQESGFTPVESESSSLMKFQTQSPWGFRSNTQASHQAQLLKKVASELTRPSPAEKIPVSISQFRRLTSLRDDLIPFKAGGENGKDSPSFIEFVQNIRSSSTEEWRTAERESEILKTVKYIRVPGQTEFIKASNMEELINDSTFMW